MSLLAFLAVVQAARIFAKKDNFGISFIFVLSSLCKENVDSGFIMVICFGWAGAATTTDETLHSRENKSV